MIIGAVLGLVLSGGAGEAASQAPDAQAALEKLSTRLKDARLLSARVVQTRRTELLETPITSSGMMYYRRDPAQLVFRLTDPRKVDIHLDRSSYQVYRPDEKRLERIDFGAEDVTASLLMVFEPKLDVISKGFKVSSGEVRDGTIEVRLEPSDPRVKKRLRSILLTLVQADGSLRRLTYTDADGDEVRLDLSQVAINPSLPGDLFTLQVPEGTRVLRRSLGQEKDK